MYGGLEECPACKSDVGFVEQDKLYSVWCPNCRYRYGFFKGTQSMAMAWNVLAKVFPSSIRSMARSLSKNGG